VRRVRHIAALLAVVAAAAAAVTAATGATRAKWDTRVLTLIPRPGFPAHAYVDPNGRVYEGTYDNPSGDTMRSRVFEIGGDGTLLRSWTVRGQDLSTSHGVQVATSDAHGRLLLLDKSPPRVLLLNIRTGRQRTYATFPAGAVPNYAAWGPDGSLYVSDYQEPVLWRIPPRGGKPVEWLRDPQLDGGGQFGATGLELLADRSTLMVGMQSEAGAGAGDPTTGRLLKVTIGADGKPGKLTPFWESRPFDGPDGFAVAKSGNVYVALLVPNQIGVIGPDGVEKERFPTMPGAGADGSAVPFDSPSSIQFLGKRLMVANQSYFTGTATNQAVLDVYAGEPGLKRLIPKTAGPRH
jgi:hypothetical protein